MTHSVFELCKPCPHDNAVTHEVEAVTGFIFLGSKMTVDNECSHKIKRCLLLGRKAMINIGNVLKSRDIILPTKVCIVKAMIFLVVVYRCESWTIKKAERQELMFTFGGARESSWESLGLPRRSIQWILKEIKAEYSLEGLTLKLKLQYFGHLMQRANSLEKTLILGKIEGRRRRDYRAWDGWMASLTHGTWVWANKGR